MTQYVFDAIIFVFLIAGGALLIETATQWKHLKHKQFRFVLALVVGLGWFTVFYGSFIEPKTLVVKSQDVYLSEETEHTLHALVVADFHVGPYKKTSWVRHVADKVNEQGADVVLIPGDFIFGKPEEVLMMQPMSIVDAPLGVYAVTGNHDYTGNRIDYVVEFLERYGMEVLEDESVRIPVEGEQEMTIVGVSDLWFAGEMESAMDGVTKEEMSVLLSHNPDAVLYEDAGRADLVIAGHTHGGQIRLPFIGPVPPLPTELGRAFSKGLYDYVDQQLFITSGVSETGPRARLFNPPEIVNLYIHY